MAAAHARESSPRPLSATLPPVSSPSQTNTFPPERFEEIRRLGEGGMAWVVLARDLELDRPVAIKWIHRELQEHGSAAQRFRNEARFLGAVEHPNVLRVYGCVEGRDGAAGLVMEYVQGRDLQQELEAAGRVGPEEVRAVGIQVADGLEALHQKGIFHRDLKPANLMRRDDDGRVILMDLGLASSSEVTRMTRTGYLVGTLLYMAPEVVKGGEYTPQADVYQLGATLWELATGKEMIPVGRMDACFQSILEGQRGSADLTAWGIPEDLWAAILSAVEVDPARRPAGAAAFREALRGDGGPPPDTASPAPGTASGKRWAGLAAGVVVLAMVAGAPGFLGDGPPQDVRWRVLGGSVVVETALGGPADLRIEVDGEVAAARFEAVDGRRRAVVPGVGSARERALRLFWDGGQGPIQRLRGQPEALGAVELGGPGSLLVHARRDCGVGFGELGDRLWGLTSGHHPLPAPPRSRPTFRLRWQEEGVEQSRQLSWAELFTREAIRLADAFSQVDVHRALVQASVDRTRPSFAAERARWEPALPWLPELLAHPGVPVAVRRRLHRVFQTWERSVDEETYLGREATRLALPADGAGGRMALDVNEDPGDRSVPAPVAGRRVPVSPDDCAALAEEREAFLVATPYTRTIPIGQFAEACEVLTGTWPDLRAKPGEPVRLWVRAARLQSRGVIRITSGDLLVELWRPGATEERMNFRGWLGITLPGDLWPRPGEPVALEVVDLLRPQATVAKIGTIRLERLPRD